MREIKFRGINHETGEFVYGWYTKHVEGIRRFNAIISEVDGELVRYYIHDRKTIGQFTGLHDKNGKEIYEGDILVRYSALVPMGTNPYVRQIVKWDEYKWAGINGWNACEVIGTIHDAPKEATE